MVHSRRHIAQIPPHADKLNFRWSQHSSSGRCFQVFWSIHIELAQTQSALLPQFSNINPVSGRSLLLPSETFTPNRPLSPVSAALQTKVTNLRPVLVPPNTHYLAPSIQAVAIAVPPATLRHLLAFCTLRTFCGADTNSRLAATGWLTGAQWPPPHWSSAMSDSMQSGAAQNSTPPPPRPLLQPRHALS